MSVYLDHNASTPIDERVYDAMLPFLKDHHGNPSSLHCDGRVARAGLDRAREQVAALVNVQPGQVIFTSGGTESNNLAIKGVAASLDTGALAISAIEHASVLETAQTLQQQDWKVDTIAVDTMGCVTKETLQATLHTGTRLVSVMMANNESGVLQDVAMVSNEVRVAGAIMHTDAVQAIAKMEVDFAATGAHLMSLSGHKINGPKGVGALIVDNSVELQSLLHGGHQEMGRRAGTENVAGIVGFGMAAELAGDKVNRYQTHVNGLRQKLESGLARMPGVVIFAEKVPRLPNTTLLAVPGIDGETMLMNLDNAGIAVSSGAACSSGDIHPSHVLLAMGVGEDLARTAIRVSLGLGNSAEDIDEFLNCLQKQMDALQAMDLRAWA